MMQVYKIAVIPGDGIGTEVVTEGVLSIQAGENTRIIREKIKSVIEMESKEEDHA